MRSSQAAFDLIVAEEVSSQAVYTRKYRKPEWPGESSGATIGIGYDLGQTPRATVTSDWDGRVPDDMLDAMLSACGATGSAGQAATARIRSKVDIPWATAIAVHEECVVPRWEARVAAALPNTDKLSGDCFGALLSLAFNRGTSFSKPGPRYAEMRNIKAHMAAEDFAAIPDEFRAMKRLWPNTAGLRKRRDTEATLFERGLRKKAAVVDAASTRPPRPDPIEETIDAPTVPVAPTTPATVGVQGDPDLWHVQRRLTEMKYAPGGLDGIWGNMTSGAIAGFINDRRLGISSPTSIEMFHSIKDTLNSEISKAETERFVRPIAPERSAATEETVSAKVQEMAPIKQNRFAALWAAISAAFLAVVNAVADYAKEALSWISQLKDHLNGVPGWVWLSLFVGSCLFFYYNSRKGAAGIVSSFQKGERS